MSRETSRIVHAVLRELPPDEQLASLICAIIERKPQAMSALVSMLAVLGVMARHVSTENRIALAELMRDAADELERRRVKVPNA
jgi:hypothetical protein